MAKFLHGPFRRENSKTISQHLDIDGQFPAGVAIKLVRHFALGTQAVFDALTESDIAKKSVYASALSKSGVFEAVPK